MRTMALLALLTATASTAVSQLASSASMTPSPAATQLRDQQRAGAANARNDASPFVPIDSWIYPAFDRLASMGFVPSGSAIVRPWTRIEAARMLAEARLQQAAFDESSLPVLDALDTEFREETAVLDGHPNRNATVDSAYERLTTIAGTPLRDGFHFGQSIVDDFGRPYGQGANTIAGTEGRASYRAFTVYLRAEYQYASAISPYSPTAQQAISAYDTLPYGWNLRLGTTDRLVPVEAYVATNFARWQLSFGQQSLWWGPDRGTSLILSNNAAAMPMLRLARTQPAVLPGFLRRAGPIHLDAFLARQGGIHYVGLGTNFTLYGSSTRPLTPPPYIWGIILSAKPTENLEIGFAHTVIFAGYGRPLTFGTFAHTFSVLGNGQDVDPGKRVTEFNFNYHPPLFRKSLVVYDEAMAWDDPIEGKFVARFAMAPGIYLPRIPAIGKLDLRVEGVYTDLPKLSYQAYFYANAHYIQGYTNYGQILGSWVGRQGIGGQTSTSYWFSPRNKATLTYRRMYADKVFLQGGGLSDFSASFNWLLKPQFELSASGQFENRNFPLLQTTRSSNFTTTFQLRFYPTDHPGRPAIP